MRTKYSSQLDNRFEPILACNSFCVPSASSTAESVHYLDELLTCSNRREKLKMYFGLLQFANGRYDRHSHGAQKPKQKSAVAHKQTDLFCQTAKSIYHWIWMPVRPLPACLNGAACSCTACRLAFTCDYIILSSSCRGSSRHVNEKSTQRTRKNDRLMLST